jgi:hypothetical protein
MWYIAAFPVIFVVLFNILFNKDSLYFRKQALYHFFHFVGYK